MKNQVGREIPDEILARMGKTGYRGLHDRDNASYRKASCAHPCAKRWKSASCMTACISASTTISATEIM